MPDNDSASVISKEGFMEMIKHLDRDGDGTVDKEEYKVAYKQLFGKEEGFEETWAKLDKDGDGNLTVEELATYYGFSMDGADTGSSNEMTDEQILEALQLASTLAEANKPKEEPKKEEDVKDAKDVPRDPSIEVIDSEKIKKDPELKAAKQKEIDFLEACTLGDLVSSDASIVTVSRALEQKCNVRVEDEKGEGALHKLARYSVTDANKVLYKDKVKEVFEAMRAACDKASKKLTGDVNRQDKAGKTPLFMAVENKNTTMIELLYGLGKDGPDTLLVNSWGWTVMHAAVNTDDLQVVQLLVKHFTPARKKLLLSTQDKTGREPLHIAAYKCGEGLVEYLVSLGATNQKKDSAGNTAAKLADRSGRRKSREIIEKE